MQLGVVQSDSPYWLEDMSDICNRFNSYLKLLFVFDVQICNAMCCVLKQICYRRIFISLIPEQVLKVFIEFEIFFYIYAVSLFLFPR